MDPHLILGDWNAQCDRCGFQYKSTQLRLQWNNLRCCFGGGTNGCWEPRNRQEFVRGKPDRQAPPWTRSDTEGPDVSPGSGNEVKASDL